MTREEAIRRFKNMKKILSVPNSDAQRTIEAIDMAIYALMREQQFMYNASQGTTTILKIGNRHFEVRELMIFRGESKGGDDE